MKSWILGSGPVNPCRAKVEVVVKVKMSSESKPVRQLVGFDNFKRHNPFSDKFAIQRFHSLEFYCNDATNVSRRFMWGLGNITMQLQINNTLIILINYRHAYGS